MGKLICKKDGCGVEVVPGGNGGYFRDGSVWCYNHISLLACRETNPLAEKSNLWQVEIRFLPCNAEGVNENDKDYQEGHLDFKNRDEFLAFRKEMKKRGWHRD